MKGIKDKIAIVTGANKGIGKAIAQAFLEEGATVVLCGGRVSGILDGRTADKNEVGMMMTELGGSERIKAKEREE